MRFGVIRVVDAEILWLTAGGKFRELSTLTWCASREEAFLRARRVRGLVVKIPDPVKSETQPRDEDARQRVFKILPPPDTEEKSSDAEFEAVHAAMVKFRTGLAQK